MNINKHLSVVPNLNIKQLISIDDSDLIIELSESAPRTLPTFLVKNKRTYKDHIFQSDVYVLDHVGSDLEYLLVIDSFDESYDCKLYLKPDWFNSNSRKILQNDDQYSWMFEDGNDYPKEIYCDGITYVRKVTNEIFENTAIIEYDTSSYVINHLLLLIETGIYHDNGGLVEFYEGRRIEPDTLKV